MNNKLILTFGSLFSGSLLQAAERPNIIFVLIDDLGKEWIEAYGADIKTPNINSLSEQGITFSRAYSMPQSTPSRVVLMTGQYPCNNGWINHYDVPRWGHGAQFDVEKNPCFPRELQKIGYKTCVAGKWQLNDFRIQPDIMNRVGFDEYCMWTGAEKGNEKVSANRYWDPYIHTKEGSKVYKGKFGPDIYSDFIVDFINDNKDKPFLVYYPMTLTHMPLVHTPLEPDAKTAYEKHCAMVRYTDFIIGKLLKAVEDAGVKDNTYIFFTTDNGTVGTVVGRRDDVYVRGGKTYLSENGINTPFLVIGPNIKAGSKTDALIDFADVYPTLLDLGGTKKVDSRVDGKSFAALLRGDRNYRSKEFAMSMGGHPAMIGKDGMVKNYFSFRDRAIIGEKYKIYLSVDRKISRIYDMQNDPYEKTDLVNNAKVMKEVKAEFGKYIDNLPAKDANPKYSVLKECKYDEPADVLNESSERTHSRYKNKIELATKEDYDKFKNRTTKKKR